MLSPGLQAALLGNASKRPLLNLDFAKGVYSLNGAQYPVGSLPGWSFTGGPATAPDANGNLTSFASNVPPITNLGLQVWEGRTNLLIQSGFASGWFPTASTLTAAAATGPDGTASAATLIENSANTQHYMNSTSITKTASTSITYTQSVYAKPIGTRNLKLSVNDGTGNGIDWYVNPTTGATVSGPTPFGSGIASVSTSFSTAANGFIRATHTITVNTASGALAAILQVASGSSSSYTGDGASGLTLYGPQLEVASVAGPYIPTTSAAVTKAADVGALTGLTIPTTATLIVKYGPVPTWGSDAYLAQLDDGTINNRLLLYKVATAGTSGVAVLSGGSLLINHRGTPNVSASANGAMAVAISPGAVPRAAVNGTLLADGSPASGTVTGLTNLRIGSGISGVAPGDTNIRLIEVLPYAATDAQLQAFSTPDPVLTSTLLMESGSRLLLENGDFFAL